MIYINLTFFLVHIKQWLTLFYSDAKYIDLRTVKLYGIIYPYSFEDFYSSDILSEIYVKLLFSIYYKIFHFYLL